MGALRDPKLERFASLLYANLIAGMRRSQAAAEAAKDAGYEGRSLDANARKRAQRKDVKRRIAELAQPAIEKVEQQLEATVDFAVQKLIGVIAVDLGDDSVKLPDQLRAIELLAKIKGWMAPEKRDLTIRPTDQLTDDELLRIAARGSESAADPQGSA